MLEFVADHSMCSCFVDATSCTLQSVPRKDQDVSLWQENILKQASLGVEHLQRIPRFQSEQKSSQSLCAVTGTCRRHSGIVGDEQCMFVRVKRQHEVHL